MAKSLTSILSQIERLQKEAASIQSEVITRIRKDIAKYGLTAEQLFGASSTIKQRSAKTGTKASKVAKPPKYADGAGNTWGGMGKRPEWIRQALAAGKVLGDFLIDKAAEPASSKAKAPKAAAPKKAKPAAAPKAAAKKRAAAKTSAPRKPRAKAAETPAEA
ncbi:H-NS histone family protein [Roseateles cellulosilyticus]|uniref:H-NS histone family protein n=1 Tax=Pelomonas cellulosilytica TaxID=2906762 RepID=UPI0032C211EE